jgi:hypothetical protein
LRTLEQALLLRHTLSGLSGGGFMDGINAEQDRYRHGQKHEMGCGNFHRRTLRTFPAEIHPALGNPQPGRDRS